MTDDNNLSSEFLALYNQLDNHMRKRLHTNETTSHTDLLRRMRSIEKVFQIYYENLKLFANLRNSLVHSPLRENIDPIATPHEYVVNTYKKIINKVFNPPRVCDIGMKREDILTTTLESDAHTVMKTMFEKDYTYVPVLNNDIVIGVFSEHTVFSYLVANECALVEPGTKISVFKDYIPLENHKSEYFHFVARAKTIYDVKALFEEDLRDSKRIALVFITEHGKPEQKLLGLVTAWDVAGGDY